MATLAADGRAAAALRARRRGPPAQRWRASPAPGSRVAIRWRCSRMTRQVKAEQAAQRPARTRPSRHDRARRLGRRRLARSRAPSLRSTSPSATRCGQGQQIAVVEAMKMEHVITAPHGGIVRGVTMAPGDVVREGFPIVFIQQAEVAGGAVAAAAETIDLDHIRDDLRENIDAARARRWTRTGREAVARRRKNGLPDAAREHRSPRRSRARSTNTGRWSSRGSTSATRWRRCARTRRATASSPACAPSTAACSTRRARAPRSCTTTTPCWRARRGTATTTSRTGSSSWRSASGCR